MRYSPSVWLMVGCLVGLSACETTIDRGPAPPPQPAQQPVAPTPQTVIPAPQKPAAVLTTPQPAQQPAVAQPVGPRTLSKPVRANVATPAGVDDSCYRKCLEQNMMRAVTASEIAKTCQAGCPAR